MGKTAFIFPGQGAQYTGMAREFYETYEESREIFRIASETTGLDMEALCFQENPQLHQTRYTQPALLTAVCAILAAVEKEGIAAEITAGLSLGEYAALAAAKSIDFRTAADVVKNRGIYMEEAVPAGQGSMAAVLYRKPVPVEEICQQIPGYVRVANYNCPGQRVITGEPEAVEEAGKKLLEAGAARVVKLQVSGPFHSEMLRGAGEKLGVYLEEAEIRTPQIPFISNVTGMPAGPEVSDIRTLLAKQVFAPVMWEQSIREMIRMDTDLFVEIGPGKTLSGFVKKIDPTVQVCHVETPADLRELVTLIKEKRKKQLC